jgi:beta-1,4-N-acetylglucosaminyltransferase
VIFVTVGTHTVGFDRLIRAVDEYASVCDEEVVIQRGSSTYLPSFAKSFAWETSERIDGFIRDAQVVISHAGAGSVMQVLQVGRPLILAPRLKRYGEHHDDHQLELARALAAQHRAVVLQQISAAALGSAREEAMHLVVVAPDPRQLIESLRSQLAAWDRKPPRSSGRG